MRFTKEKELRDAHMNGTRKRKHKFLWFPLTIDGETRWLETATIEYRVKWEYDFKFDRYYYWDAWCFVNE